MTIHYPFKSAVAALSLLLCSGLAQARDYQVEVVIFENLSAQNFMSGGLFYPHLQDSLRLDSETAFANGFVPLERDLTLRADAEKIAEAQGYRLLRHLAWRQPGLNDADAKAVRVALGDAIPMYIADNVDSDADVDFFPGSVAPLPDRARAINTSVINGTIAVRLGRFLHMDVLLAFTDANTGQTYRLSQSRKMRSGELHYIDNPRFGLLTRITPLEDTADSSAGNATDAVTEG